MIEKRKKLKNFWWRTETHFVQMQAKNEKRKKIKFKRKTGKGARYIIM